MGGMSLPVCELLVASPDVGILFALKGFSDGSECIHALQIYCGSTSELHIQVKIKVAVFPQGHVVAEEFGQGLVEHALTHSRSYPPLNRCALVEERHLIQEQGGRPLSLPHGCG